MQQVPPGWTPPTDPDAPVPAPPPPGVRDPGDVPPRPIQDPPPVPPSHPQ